MCAEVGEWYHQVCLLTNVDVSVVTSPSELIVHSTLSKFSRLSKRIYYICLKIKFSIYIFIICILYELLISFLDSWNYFINLPWWFIIRLPNRVDWNILLTFNILFTILKILKCDTFIFILKILNSFVKIFFERGCVSFLNLRIFLYVNILKKQYYPWK